MLKYQHLVCSKAKCTICNTRPLRLLPAAHPLTYRCASTHTHTHMHIGVKRKKKEENPASTQQLLPLHPYSLTFRTKMLEEATGAIALHNYQPNSLFVTIIEMTGFQQDLANSAIIKKTLVRKQC